MESAEYVSCCREESGFPELLRDTMRYLSIPGYPEYCGLAFPEREERGWTVTLYIRENLNLNGWYCRAIGNGFLEACHIAARGAIKRLCSTYHGAVQSSPMRFFPPVNQRASTWIKRTAILTEIKKSRDPTLAYLVQYLLALDDEYEKLSRLHDRLVDRHQDTERELVKYKRAWMHPGSVTDSPLSHGVRVRAMSGPRHPPQGEIQNPMMAGSSNPPNQPILSHPGNFQALLLNHMQTSDKNPEDLNRREDKASMGAFLSLSLPGEGSSGQPPVQDRASKQQKLKGVLRE